VLDDIGGHSVEAVVAGDELVLLAQEAGQLPLLLLVEVRRLYDVRKLLAEARVDELE